MNTDGGGLSAYHPGMRGLFLLVENRTQRDAVQIQSQSGNDLQYADRGLRRRRA